MFLLSFLNHNEHSNNNAFDVCQYFFSKSIQNQGYNASSVTSSFRDQISKNYNRH